MSPAPPEGAARLTAFASASRGFLRRHRVALALLVVGWMLPLWVFLELADEVLDAEAFAWDDPILMFAQGMARDGFDRVFLFFSAIGYQWGVVPFDVVLVATLLLRRRVRETWFAAIALGGSGLLNVATKQFFARDRPSLWESIAPEHNYSFPSGHAMGSMTLAAVLVILAWRTRWRWPVVAAMAVFVPMVGLSRVYLGVHFPSDIVAGWCAALVWVVGVALLVLRRRSSDPAGAGDRVAADAANADRPMDGGRDRGPASIHPDRGA